ncbi:MAG: hypothetical protein CL840_10360 [Crocinitomicaceae bacterium]|nr:hypothetical protein [Crocinitomicaceae bacterium]|tara:strand:+ start:3375 stop:4796 length:1422 start_codon:yes stop_codon:yes gene_type:complete
MSGTILYGSFFLLIAAILFYTAFQFYRSNNFKLSLGLITLGGLLMRIFTSLDPFLHEWDERYHALVAKNLTKHPLLPTFYDVPILEQDLLWVGGHVWLHKQPLTLWLIAGSLELFGVSDFAVRLPSILLSTAMIVLTYYIGKSLFGSKEGIIAAFFIAVNGLFIELSAGRIATDHVDICFAFFIELAILFAIKHRQNLNLKWVIPMSVSIGLAILAKWLPALIVIPVWLLLTYNKSNWKISLLPLSVCLIITSAVFIPWQVYIHTSFPVEAAHEQAMNWRHFTEALEDQTGPFYYFFHRIMVNYGELVYIPLIWFLFSKRTTVLKTNYRALLIWILIPMVFFSIPITKMQGYVLFIAPALFIITAYFINNINSVSTLANKPWLSRLVIFLFFFLAFRYSVERIKPFQERDTPEWKTEILELKASHSGEKLVIFNCEHYAEAMFYTNFIAYDRIPNENDLAKVKAAGYNYLILE